MSRPLAPHLRAILFALAGFTLWVISDSFMKLAAQQSAPAYEIMAISGISGLILIFTFMAARGKLSLLRPKKHTALCAMGPMFPLNYVLGLKALEHLPLANYYTVIFLSPTLVAVIAARLLKEHIDWCNIAAILAGFIGVVIAVNPEQVLNAPADWASYGAAFFLMLIVVAQQLTLRLVADHESRESAAFYPRMGLLLGGCFFTLLYGFVPINHQAMIYSLMVGIVGSVGWIFMVQAYKLATASTVTTFYYSQIITGAAIGYIIWHDVPSAHLVTGAVIIILSGLYIVKHLHKTARIRNTILDTP